MTPLDEKTKYAIAARPDGVFVAFELVIPEELALLFVEKIQKMVDLGPPDYRELAIRLANELVIAIQESRRMR